MKIHVIVLQDRPEDSPYIIEAWDEYSIEENDRGFAEAVQKAKKGAGSSEVRVGIINVPDWFLRDLFKPLEVHATIPTARVPIAHSQWNGRCVEECLHPDHKKES